MKTERYKIEIGIDDCYLDFTEYTGLEIYSDYANFESRELRGVDWSDRKLLASILGKIDQRYKSLSDLKRFGVLGCFDNYREYRLIDSDYYEMLFDSIWEVTDFYPVRLGGEDRRSREFFAMVKDAKQARALLRSFRQWSDGEIFRYEIINVATGQVVDDCGGYLGYEEASQAASEMLSYLVKKDQAETKIYDHACQTWASDKAGL